MIYDTTGYVSADHCQQSIGRYWDACSNSWNIFSPKRRDISFSSIVFRPSWRVNCWKVRPHLMCCNVLHHRGSETRQRCTIDHDCAISRATTKGRHTFYDGVFHGTAAAAQRDQENPRALQQQQSVPSSSVSPNISHSSQRIYISRVPNNVSLRSYRFFCLRWLARPPVRSRNNKSLLLSAV